MGPEGELDRLAARQHGVISSDQALAAGFTAAQIAYRVDAGRWVRMAKGVYALASSIPSWERRLQAALFSHERAVAGGRSAAFLHGFTGFNRTRPEILVPFTGNARTPFARVIRSRHFEAIATTVIDGFPCTTVAETILTLSLREWPATIERLVDDRLNAGQLSILDFDPILERLEHARQPGLAALRHAVAQRDSDSYQPPTNVLEHLLYRMLDHPELPPYSRQVPLSYEDLNARVDAYIPLWNIVVEADGRRWHTRMADFEKDRARDNAAAAAGILVIRFTFRMLKHDPANCLETLLRAGRFRKPA